MTASKRLRVKERIRNAFIYLFVIAAILPIVWLTGRYIEAFLLICAFLTLRYKFDTTYHHDKTHICLFITLSVACVSIPITLPINISILSGVFVAFAITYVAWLVQAYLNSQESNKRLRARNVELTERVRVADVYSMNEGGIRALCKSNFLDPIDEEIAVQRLIYRLKGQELYDKIGYSKAQMTRREKHIEQVLGVKLK